MRARPHTPRHARRAALLGLCLHLAACAAGTVAEDAPDADAPLLSAQASPPGGPDQWLPSNGDTPDAEVGSPDASDPGPEAPVVFEGAGGAPADPAPPVDPAAPAPAPATEAPGGPGSAPGSAPAPQCVAAAETCNGLDDDCDGAIDDGAGCPCDVAVRDGRPYLICVNQMGWFAARNICHSVGYDLAVANDAGEDAFLFGELQRRGLGGAWIGLNDHVAEGQWVWLDGQPLLYSHWDQGEPNNGGNGGEDCGIIMTDPNRAAEWDDRECDSTRPFLCELSEG